MFCFCYVIMSIIRYTVYIQYVCLHYIIREPRFIMIGDFNARDERWCRNHNKAGRLLNEQLQNLDNLCLINHPQVWTTINKTAIDLSLFPVDTVPLANWSIYRGLLSDHLAALLKIQHQHNNERVPVPKRWLTQHADWEIYREHITIATTSIEWTYVYTYGISFHVIDIREYER